VNLSDAVDTDFFAPEKALPLRRDARPTILLPARVGPGKGHRDLIAAGCILRGAGADFALCFAGAVESESLHQELRWAVVDEGLQGRVRFLGQVSAEEMRDLYAQSSVVVLPSYSEGLPRVLLEAQAMEKPVVAYNCGGTGEALLPDKSGFLLDKGNVEDLASKAGLLLRDEARRLRMGELGRKFVARQFGVPALVERHERFYLSTLSAAPARRV
jgi:glycosyltransferase involved in cell wall biosynthesis